MFTRGLVGFFSAWKWLSSSSDVDVVDRLNTRFGVGSARSSRSRSDTKRLDGA